MGGILLKGIPLNLAGGLAVKASIVSILMAMCILAMAQIAYADFGGPIVHPSLGPTIDPQDLGVTLTLDKDTIYPGTPDVGPMYYCDIIATPVYKSSGSPAYGANVTLRYVALDADAASFYLPSGYNLGNELSHISNESAPGVSARFLSQLPGRFKIIATVSMDGYNSFSIDRALNVVESPTATPTVVATVTPTASPTKAAPSTTVTPVASSSATTATVTAAGTPTTTTTATGTASSTPAAAASSAKGCLPLLLAPLLPVCAIGIGRLYGKKGRK
jgi:hypothetical protein